MKKVYSGACRCPFRRRLCRLRQRRRLSEQPAEGRRLVEVALRGTFVEAELREDRRGVDRPRCLAGAPEPGEPFAELPIPRIGVEDPSDDELRRDGAVPAVLLEAERDVVGQVAPEAVE